MTARFELLLLVAVQRRGTGLVIQPQSCEVLFLLVTARATDSSPDIELL